MLPHGILFNHSTTALEFQRAFFTRHAVDRVLNLADYQWFLFEEAGHPALVIAYQSKPPDSPQHVIEYWAPKVDWLITRAEVIAVMPEDRSTLSVGQVLKDLAGRDAPQIWKQRYWATPRDWRLIDRLSLYPRLRNHVRRAREKAENKPWVMAEGFQPVGPSDDPTKAEVVQLPSTLFIAATSPKVDLFLLPGDCMTLPRSHVTMRSGSNKSTDIFRAPHVLVTKGFTGTAFADFDVSFRHALRGISGPQEDRTCSFSWLRICGRRSRNTFSFKRHPIGVSAGKKFMSRDCYACRFHCQARCQVRRVPGTLSRRLLRL